MLSRESCAAIFAAERLDHYRAARMLINPRGEVVDLAVDSAPTITRGVMSGHLGEGDRSGSTSRCSSVFTLEFAKPNRLRTRVAGNDGKTDHCDANSTCQ